VAPHQAVDRCEARPRVRERVRAGPPRPPARAARSAAVDGSATDRRPAAPRHGSTRPRRPAHPGRCPRRRLVRGHRMSAWLRDVIGRADLVVTAGPGGVGKTSTAAALGVAGALAGRRVIVLTVDPARRLADALGLAAGAGAD